MQINFCDFGHRDERLSHIISWFSITAAVRRYSNLFLRSISVELYLLADSI